ncbi:DNA mismatch repair protein MutS [Candidatus Dojkabacteria bacterium]|nr:DNA mismatch repair protein MutS [Candidatus Dojkabacteria bacterium]
MADTPMMKQYKKLKYAHSDAILFFRLGDFYEAFNDDAKDIAKILNITLTGRGKGENRVPMAGIPHHAMKRYLKKLVNSGRKVAIAEQMTEAAQGKIVEREVTKIITAGTISDLEYLDEATNNYLAAVFKEKENYYLAFCDLTTGEFRTLTLDSEKDLNDEIYRINPNEILISESQLRDFQGAIIKQLQNFQTSEESLWDIDNNLELLKKHFNLNNFKSLGYEKTDLELIPAGVILDYLKQTQKTDLEHIKNLKKLNRTDYMQLDPSTIINLELVWPIRAENKNATLFSVLNNCQTPMGQRKLKNWILHPLIKRGLIQARLDAVEELVKDSMNTSQIGELLNNYCDLERIVSKLGTGSINARDLIFLKTSLVKTLDILEATSKYTDKLVNLNNNLSEEEKKSLNKIIELIESAIIEDPPVTITEGGLIKDGYSDELDEIKTIQQEGKTWLKKLQEEEMERTGITSLKVKFNNVFGYYIEVSKSNLDKVPENYIRKQTLVNAERFITEELKDWETKILNSEGKSNELEYEIFQDIRAEVSENIGLLLRLAGLVSTLDVLVNFAVHSRKNGYCKPKISINGEMSIENGRHPVVEKFSNEQFVANNTEMGEKQEFIILTGPNMSGKSTYIRQVAVISLIAQIGCFVPADKVELPVFDRIFTRVGASDSLSTGESTFMVEMNEAANILNNATENSLIILDEIGRGTSTYDGVAIAWSIVEYIHNRLGAKTLFATHYHELIDLESKLDNVSNYNVDVIENGEEIIFTRKVKKGSTDQSYGVYVAQMAGVPQSIVKRSKEILMTLEQDSMLDVRAIEGELIDNESESSKKHKIRTATDKPYREKPKSQKPPQIELL